jgi:hypothetical protein
MEGFRSGSISEFVSVQIIMDPIMDTHPEHYIHMYRKSEKEWATKGER